MIDESSEVIKDKLIHLTNTQSGQNYTLSSDEDGFFKFNLNLTQGTYDFDLKFLEDEFYSQSDLSFIVNVLRKDAPNISIEKDSLNVYETLNILLKDNDGNVIGNKLLKIIISDKRGNEETLYAETNDEGIVDLTDLTSGIYNLAVSLENDEEYNDASFN